MISQPHNRFQPILHQPFSQEDENQTINEFSISPWRYPLHIEIHQYRQTSQSEVKLSRKNKHITLPPTHIVDNLHYKKPTTLSLMQQPNVSNIRKKKSSKRQYQTPEIVVKNYMNWMKRSHAYCMKSNSIHKIDSYDSSHNFLPNIKSPISSTMQPTDIIEQKFYFANSRRDLIRSRRNSLKKYSIKTERDDLELLGHRLHPVTY